MTRAKQFPALFGLAACVVAGGCTVGPKYQRATAPVPAKWDVPEPWREGAPKDSVPKGEWWSVFRDEDLSALEKQALDANQTIKIAAARLEQARASAAIQIATQFPALTTAPSVQRQRLSGQRSQPRPPAQATRRSARQCPRTRRRSPLRPPPMGSSRAPRASDQALPAIARHRRRETAAARGR